MRPSVKQQGGFLGSLLASIGIPLALQLFKKMTGKGAPRMGKYKGKGAPRMGKYQGKGSTRVGLEPPAPFIGTWQNQRGMGKKKSTKKKGRGPANKSASGLLLGDNSPFNSIPILGALL